MLAWHPTRRTHAAFRPSGLFQPTLAESGQEHRGWRLMVTV